MLDVILTRFSQKRDAVDQWLLEKKKQAGVNPFYASCDIRNAGYKLGIVDTNLFPAGFNNLCQGFLRTAYPLIHNYFATYFPGSKKIGILAEEHTRNTFYLENVAVLAKTITEAGFTVEIFSSLEEFERRQRDVDVVVVNNDFSGGLPDALKNTHVPLVPPPQAGWHTRRKSEHFEALVTVTDELAEILEVDPWHFFPETKVVSDISINEASSRERLAQEASEMLKTVTMHYKRNKIDALPYLYLKDDSGTYGIGIETISDAQEILTFNKKRRETFKSGKNKKPITSILLQEGIPSSERVKGVVSEPVVYSINHTAFGGFFRMHEGADERSSLNRPGMQFSKLCFHEITQYQNAVLKDCNVTDLEALYFTLGSCASIAAAAEIKTLL